jgi:hypothetical protein
MSADVVRTDEIIRFMVLLRVVREGYGLGARDGARIKTGRILQFQPGVFVNRVVGRPLIKKANDLAHGHESQVLAF